MKQYAYYYEHGNNRYVILTMTKSVENTPGGQTHYVMGMEHALWTARVNNAIRVNY